jgi:hypothetical protein
MFKKFFLKDTLFTLLLFTLLLSTCKTIYIPEKDEKITNFIEKRVQINDCLKKEFLADNLDSCIGLLHHFRIASEDLLNNYQKILVDFKNFQQKYNNDTYELKMKNKTLENSFQECKEKLREEKENNRDLIDKIKSFEKNDVPFTFILKIGGIFFMMGFLFNYFVKFVLFAVRKYINPLS